MSRKMRAIVAFVLIAIIITASIVPNNALVIKRLYGDIDNDGYITTEDARTALLVAAGISDKVLRGLDFESADIDSDGRITTQDARNILKVAAGMSPETEMKGYEFSEEPEAFAKLINDYRFEKNHDATKFTLSKELCNAARVAAEEYALKTNNAFIRDDGTYFYKLLNDMNIKYTFADKIVLHSSFSYEYTVEQILKDPQAEKAIISGNFTKLGLGAYSSDGRTFYWCIFLVK